MKSILCLLSVVMAGVMLNGCASSPDPHQYVFSSGEGWKAATSRDVASSKYIIRFAPVRLPAYLDRPQIVTRLSENQINSDEFHRWGIPLDVTIAEILGAGLARYLPEAYIDVLPSRGQKDTGYQIKIDVARLDGILGGTVELIAQWKITREGETADMIAQRLTRYQKDAVNKTYEAYVEAVRLTVAEMAKEMAAVIEETEQ